MAEIRKHLDDTFVTLGRGRLPGPGPLAGAYGATQGSAATQMHVHSVIRTPNGNDYGKELLRQHYLTSPHHQ
ncbi:hypothetical protein ABZT06_46045 [Streptomyces sp. NPDC005483]|uniref:hypothetical protein n=1 Tax=Streptomyces sp. NPDC005483 TaxID=3154882 RepID=UPI0033BF14E8